MTMAKLSAEATREPVNWHVSVFARCDGSILLTRDPGSGDWLPLRSAIGVCETPQIAAQRVLVDETGLEATFPMADSKQCVPAGFLSYEEGWAQAQRGIHVADFSFVADVSTVETLRKRGNVDRRWLSTTNGVECPDDVRRLFVRALEFRHHPEPGICRVCDELAARPGWFLCAVHRREIMRAATHSRWSQDAFREVAERRHRGDTWKTIARHFGVSQGRLDEVLHSECRQAQRLPYVAKAEDIAAWLNSLLPADGS